MNLNINRIQIVCLIFSVVISILIGTFILRTIIEKRDNYCVLQNSLSVNPSSYEQERIVMHINSRTNVHKNRMLEQNGDLVKYKKKSSLCEHSFTETLREFSDIVFSLCDIYV